MRGCPLSEGLKGPHPRREGGGELTGPQVKKHVWGLLKTSRSLEYLLQLTFPQLILPNPQRAWDQRETQFSELCGVIQV